MTVIMTVVFMMFFFLLVVVVAVIVVLYKRETKRGELYKNSYELEPNQRDVPVHFSPWPWECSWCPW